MKGRKGPKPQPGVRQKNGRLSQVEEIESARRKANGDKTEWETMSTAMMARHRLFNLPYPAHPQDRAKKDTPHARDPLAGSVVGRMVLAGELTRLQGDAATTYAEDMANYNRAMSGPRQPGAVDLNASRGSSTSSERLAFVDRAKRRYVGPNGKSGIKAAIQEACNQHRGTNIFAALDYIILRDEYHEHMVGDLRIGLNALARAYGIMDAEKAVWNCNRKVAVDEVAQIT